MSFLTLSILGCGPVIGDCPALYGLYAIPESFVFVSSTSCVSYPIDVDIVMTKSTGIAIPIQIPNFLALLR